MVALNLSVDGYTALILGFLTSNYFHPERITCKISENLTSRRPRLVERNVLVYIYIYISIIPTLKIVQVLTALGNR